MHCNLLFIMYLYQYIKVIINFLCINIIYIFLCRNEFLHCFFSSLYLILPLIHPSDLSKIRQVRDRFMSEEGHFSPLVEGVKLLPNPLFFCFLSSKTPKTADFHFQHIRVRKIYIFQITKLLPLQGAFSDCYYTQDDAMG